MNVALNSLAILYPLLAACSPAGPSAGGCPCDEGWHCCPGDVCLPEGELCGLDTTSERRLSLENVDAPHPCRIGIDSDGDGWEDGETIVSHDGTMVDYATDFGLDGSRDELWRETYDDAGRIQTQAAWEGGELSWRYSFEYDQLDRVVVEHRFVGSPVYLEQVQYVDYSGSYPVVDVDIGADGVLDERKHVTLDGAGRVIEEAVDEGLDGSIDDRAGREWGVDGKSGYSWYDDDDDGDREWQNWFERVDDAEGRYLDYRLTHAGPDGVPELFLHFEALARDGHGRLLEERVEGLGPSPELLRYEYECE